MSELSYNHDRKGIGASHLGMADAPDFLEAICGNPPEKIQSELLAIVHDYPPLPHPDAYGVAGHKALSFLHELLSDVRGINSELGWSTD